MSMVSAMVPYLCPLFSVWLEYPELLLLLVFYAKSCEPLNTQAGNHIANS
jgi:hypothetical protein